LTTGYLDHYISFYLKVKKENIVVMLLDMFQDKKNFIIDLHHMFLKVVGVKLKVYLKDLVGQQLLLI